MPLVSTTHTELLQENVPLILNRHRRRLLNHMVYSGLFQLPLSWHFQQIGVSLRIRRHWQSGRWSERHFHRVIRTFSRASSFKLFASTCFANHSVSCYGDVGCYGNWTTCMARSSNEMLSEQIGRKCIFASDHARLHCSSNDDVNKFVFLLRFPQEHCHVSKKFRCKICAWFYMGYIVPKWILSKESLLVFEGQESLSKFTSSWLSSVLLISLKDLYSNWKSQVYVTF